MRFLSNSYIKEIQYIIQGIHYFFRDKITKNLFNKILYKKNKIKLNSLQLELIKSIKAKGYAKVSVDQLFQNKNNFIFEFNQIVKKIKKTKDYECALEYFNKNFEETGKHYIHRINDNKNFKIDINSILIKFILSDKILDIVNSYFQMYAKLDLADLWITFFNNKCTLRKNAQRWHRDRDDVKILKIFLYLGEINEDNGATEYIQYSKKNQKYDYLSKFSYGNIAGWKVYPNEQKVDKSIDLKDKIILRGKPGTIYFVDTTGLHRGGYSNKNKGERIFGYWSFLTPASLLKKKNYLKPDKEKFNKLGFQQRMAIN